MSHRVSVILPTYNRADLIGETIETLLSQTRPIDDILVVDDGSTDETRAVIARYGNRVAYLYKQNGGKADALNHGMREVSGDLIWICDDDDLLAPNACEILTGALEDDPSLDFVAGHHADFTTGPESGARLIKPAGYSRASTPDTLFSDLLDGCHIFQPGLLVRRDHYQKTGPFNIALARSQDYDMLLRLARHGKGKLLPDRVFLHREHTGRRGPAAERFDLSKLNSKWIKFHRLIMAPLLADLTDEEMLPSYIWNDPERIETRHRTAALKRASVYGRHLMWLEAVAAFRQIAKDYTGPLNDYETGLVRAATLYTLGCAPLFEDKDIQSGLWHIKRQSKLGRRIVSELGIAVQWRLRRALMQNDVNQVFRVAKFVLRARFMA